MEMSRDAGSIPAASINKPLAKYLQVAYFIGIASFRRATEKRGCPVDLKKSPIIARLFVPLTSGFCPLDAKASARSVANS